MQRLRALTLSILILFSGRGICDTSPLKSNTVVVVGILKEATLARGPGISVLVSGSRPAQLKSLLNDLDLSDVRAIISFGVAGGLSPTVDAGDLIVPREVLFGDQRWTTDHTLRAALISALNLRGFRVRESALLGSNEVILDSRMKSDLHHFYQADAVDMESHVAAAFAAAHRIPLLVVRAVSDPAYRTLPPSVLDAINENGKINFFKILRNVLRDPPQIIELIQAGADSNKAFTSLGACQDLLR